MAITATTQARLAALKAQLEEELTRGQYSLSYEKVELLDAIEALLGGGVTIPAVTVDGIGTSTDAAAPVNGGNGELVAQAKRTNLNLEEIRDLIGGGGAGAVIASGQAIVTTQRVTLPEFDTVASGNTADPLFSATGAGAVLNASSTGVYIKFRPAASYFNTAKTDDNSASVLNDAVCWTVDGTDPAATAAVPINQAATAGVYMSRALATAFRVGAHIQTGGDDVEAFVYELSGPVTAELLLFDPTLDIASLTNPGSGFSDEQVVGNAIASATSTENAAATVTISAPAAGSRIRLFKLIGGYRTTTGAVTPAGLLTVTATGMGTITAPATSEGLGFVPVPVDFPLATAVTATLSAGGVGVTGYLNAVYRIV